MQTGWEKIGGTWYYFNSSGAMLTGWQNIGGKWYYFNGSGHMLIGWQKIGGLWYWFNGSGHMITGFKQISGVWYYFRSSGAMHVGWAEIGGKWYYFRGSGAMVTGFFVDGIYKYYATSSGAMHTGWLSYGGKWYWFNSSGHMAVNGWYKISNKWYKFDGNGIMTVGVKKKQGSTTTKYHTTLYMSPADYLIPYVNLELNMQPEYEYDSEKGTHYNVVKVRLAVGTKTYNHLPFNVSCNVYGVTAGSTSYYSGFTTETTITPSGSQWTQKAREITPVKYSQSSSSNVKYMGILQLGSDCLPSYFVDDAYVYNP